ncbi:hypothetical protein, partial [Nitratireductor sp. XY-223]|uniref:hypothetical protein n=1 Tax=Nitratireductor sp. XY-223 TaxID=2561926 RepID=UPI001FED43E1
QFLERHGFHRHVFDVEAPGLNGSKNLLDNPASTVELGDPSCLFERFNPVGGQQSPMRGFHTVRRVDFSRLDEMDGLAVGNTRFKWSVLGMLQGNAPEANANARRALLVPGSCRQLDDVLLLRLAIKAGKELACIVGKIAIMGRSDQDFHLFRTARKHLEYVCFTVSDHRDSRSRTQSSCGSLHAFNPTIALLFTKGSVSGWLFAATSVFKELHVERPEQRALFGFNGNGGVSENAVSQSVITKGSRVLNRQNMQAVNATTRVLASLFHKLFLCHLPVPQKPTKADLISTIAANASDRDAARATRYKAFMKDVCSPIQTKIPKMRTRILQHLCTVFETSNQEEEIESE